jgi:sirohydrochlorin cobaltochelatase
VGVPLLTASKDYKELVGEIAAELPKTQDGEAVVLMGHGSDHYAESAYAAMDYVFKDMGMKNVFVGTVEGYPDLETVLRHVADSGANKVTLLPLMIVAGDHPNNDMAGDEEGSWKMAFKGAGYEVDCVLKGLANTRACASTSSATSRTPSTAHTTKAKQGFGGRAPARPPRGGLCCHL